MRYDTPVYLQLVTPGEYDASTGNYADDTIKETREYADVTNTGESVLKLIYGDVRQDSLTIRLQNHYKLAFDRIRIGDKVYRVDFSRRLRTKHVFVVSEVQ